MKRDWALRINGVVHSQRTCEKCDSLCWISIATQQLSKIGSSVNHSIQFTQFIPIALFTQFIPPSLCLIHTYHSHFRCTNSEKKYGSPVTCDSCRQKCAFDRSSAEKKSEGKNMCWLCTMTHKNAKEERSKEHRKRNNSSKHGSKDKKRCLQKKTADW